MRKERFPKTVSRGSLIEQGEAARSGPRERRFPKTTEEGLKRRKGRKGRKGGWRRKLANRARPRLDVSST